MKTILFPVVVLVHALSMLMGMASLSFLVFTGRPSTLMAVMLLSLTGSLAATSSKLALVHAQASERKQRKPRPRPPTRPSALPDGLGRTGLGPLSAAITLKSMRISAGIYRSLSQQ